MLGSGLLLFCSSVVILLLLLIDKWNCGQISSNVLYMMWKIVLLQMIPFSIPVWISSSAPYNGDTKFSISSCLIIIYIVIAAVFLLIGLFSFIRTQRKIYKLFLLSDSDNIHNNSYLQIIEGRISDLSKNLTVFESDGIAFPFSFGIFKHYIVLPEWSMSDDNMLLCIMQHEVIHIKRRDCLWKVIAYVICSLYWYNPFVWCLYSQLNRQCELSCDDVAIKRLGEDKKNIYLKAIVYCCERSSDFSSVSKVIQPFGSTKHFIKERIDAMMREKKKNIFIAAGIVVAVSVICLFGHFKFQQSEASAEKILVTNDGAEIETDSAATYEKVEPDDKTSVTIIKHSESK